MSVSFVQGGIAEAHIQNCTITGNSNAGVWVVGAPGSTNVATVSNSLIVSNNFGIYTDPSAANIVRLTGNTICRNSIGVVVNPGAVVKSAGDNVIDGNTTIDVSGIMTSITKR